MVDFVLAWPDGWLVEKVDRMVRRWHDATAHLPPAERVLLAERFGARALYLRPME